MFRHAAPPLVAALLLGATPPAARADDPAVVSLSVQWSMYRPKTGDFLVKFDGVVRHAGTEMRAACAEFENPGKTAAGHARLTVRRDDARPGHWLVSGEMAVVPKEEGPHALTVVWLSRAPRAVEPSQSRLRTKRCDLMRVPLLGWVVY